MLTVIWCEIVASRVVFEPRSRRGSILRCDTEEEQAEPLCDLSCMSCLSSADGNSIVACAYPTVGMPDYIVVE